MYHILASPLGRLELAVRCNRLFSSSSWERLMARDTVEMMSRKEAKRAMILWKVIKCQAPIPRSFFNHSSSLPAQQMRKRSIMTVATTFQEIQIRRRVVANSAALSTLEPSDDEIKNDSTDGDSPIHHQRLWDAAKALTRDLKPHRGWLHTTGGVRHGGGVLTFCGCTSIYRQKEQPGQI